MREEPPVAGVVVPGPQEVQARAVVGLPVELVRVRGRAEAVGRVAERIVGVGVRHRAGSVCQGSATRKPSQYSRLLPNVDAAVFISCWNACCNSVAVKGIIYTKYSIFKIKNDAVWNPEAVDPTGLGCDLTFRF